MLIMMSGMTTISGWSHPNGWSWPQVSLLNGRSVELPVYPGLFRVRRLRGTIVMTRGINGTMDVALVCLGIFFWGENEDKQFFWDLAGNYSLGKHLETSWEHRFTIRKNDQTVSVRKRYVYIVILMCIYIYRICIDIYGSTIFLSDWIQDGFANGSGDNGEWTAQLWLVFFMNCLGPCHHIPKFFLIVLQTLSNWLVVWFSFFFSFWTLPIHWE